MEGILICCNRELPLTIYPAAAGPARGNLFSELIVYDPSEELININASYDMVFIYGWLVKFAEN